MDAIIIYLPAVAFLLVILARGKMLDVRDPQLVRRPGGLWGPIRLFNDDEWTPEGLLARRRFFRTMALAFVAGILGALVVVSLGK